MAAMLNILAVIYRCVHVHVRKVQLYMYMFNVKWFLHVGVLAEPLCSALCMQLFMG